MERVVKLGIAVLIGMALACGAYLAFWAEPAEASWPVRRYCGHGSHYFAEHNVFFHDSHRHNGIIHHHITVRHKSSTHNVGYSDNLSHIVCGSVRHGHFRVYPQGPWKYIKKPASARDGEEFEEWVEPTEEDLGGEFLPGE